MDVSLDVGAPGWLPLEAPDTAEFLGALRNAAFDTQGPLIAEVNAHRQQCRQCKRFPVARGTRGTLSQPTYSRVETQNGATAENTRAVLSFWRCELARLVHSLTEGESYALADISRARELTGATIYGVPDPERPDFVHESLTRVADAVANLKAIEDRVAALCDELAARAERHTTSTPRHEPADPDYLRTDALIEAMRSRSTILRDRANAYLEASLIGRLARVCQAESTELIQELQFRKPIWINDEVQFFNGGAPLSTWPQVALIVGASGSGKSLQGLRLIIRACDELDLWVARHQGDSIETRIDPDQLPLIPIWCDAGALRFDHEFLLEHALTNNSLAISSSKYDAALLTMALQQHRVLVVVDDLTQLSISERQLLLMSVDAYARVPGVGRSDSRIVLTEVPLGLTRVEHRADLWSVHVEELAPEAVSNVLARVFRRHPELTERHMPDGDTLWHHLEVHPWSRRPLLLHYLCFSAFAGGDLPGSRADLTRDAIRMVVAHEFADAGHRGEDEVLDIVETCSRVAAQLALNGALWHFHYEELHAVCKSVDAEIGTVIRSHLIFKHAGRDGSSGFLVPDFAAYLAARGLVAMNEDLVQYAQHFDKEQPEQYARDLFAHLFWSVGLPTQQLCGALSETAPRLFVETAISACGGRGRDDLPLLGAITPYVFWTCVRKPELMSEAPVAGGAVGPLREEIQSLLLEGASEFPDYRSTLVSRFDELALLDGDPSVASRARRAVERLHAGDSAWSCLRTVCGPSPETMSATLSVITSHLPSHTSPSSSSPDADVDPAIQALVASYRERNPSGNLSLIVDAFAVARDAHRDQVQRSGDPYIAHPVGVAMILADLGLDDITLAGALLHDAVEDTSVTLDDLTARFGPDVTAIVDGVTKLDRLEFDSREAQQAATMRKMLVAMAKDVRVLLIKLADRLHNMRTVASLPEAKQKRIAQETLDIYAPLAHRLGLHDVTCQLEDLAFAVLHPKRYAELESVVATTWPNREQDLLEMIIATTECVDGAEISADVSGRVKHLWAIYWKMVVRGKEFAEINDLVGVRVIVENIKDCYAALGSIHALWRPVQGRFKDYIAMPKFNLYQSLHTTVVGPQGRAFEFEIRTAEMHRRAEYGVAAHWGYKEQRNPAEDLVWLKRIADWQKEETTDPTEFMQTLKIDLEQDEVFVFTPKGRVITLPTGATPVDFAYAIHTEVGHRCIGARVNARLVPLDSTLQSGDTCEIFTSKVEGAGPSRDWAEFAQTHRARSKVRQWFARERRVDAIDQGRDDLVKAMRREALPAQKLARSPVLAQVAEQLHYADLDGLYVAIGEGHVSARVVVQHIKRELRGGEEPIPTTVGGPPRVRGNRRASVGVRVRGLDDVMVRLSRCCTPVLGDEIMGFVTRGRGVSVHRTDCGNAVLLRSQADRVIDVEWDHDAPGNHTVSFEVEALDRSKLLRDVADVLSEHNVDILSCTSQTQSDRIARLRFDVAIEDLSHLEIVLATIRRIDSVYDASIVMDR